MSQLGVAWIAVYIGCFSIARTKLPSYITPCYPGAALLIGGFLSHWSFGLQRLSKRMMYSGAAVYAIAGGSISVALIVASQQLTNESIRMDAIWPLVLVVTGAAMALLASSTTQHSMPAILVAGASFLMASIFGSTAHKIDSQRGDLNAMIAMDSDSKWLSVGSIEPSWVFYMRSPIEEMGAESPGSPDNIERIANHLAVTGSRLLIREEEWDSLKRELETSRGMKTVLVGRFPVFLKKRMLLAVERRSQPEASLEDSKLSQRNSSKRR
jgi:4-amino-4-deoxy-L-arabinose transferase-like glycosyltransferase